MSAYTVLELSSKCQQCFEIRKTLLEYVHNKFARLYQFLDERQMIFPHSSLSHSLEMTPHEIPSLPASVGLQAQAREIHF